VWDGTATDIDLIWGGGEAEYFLNEDWTGQITLNAFKKLVFARRAFSTNSFCAEGRSIHVSSPVGQITRAKFVAVGRIEPKA
jgi:hypothetical protein